MNKQQKIPLDSMLARLQRQLRYTNPNHAFDTLLYGWARKNGHGTQWLSAAKRRNWLSLKMAQDFEAYCGYRMT